MGVGLVRALPSTCVQKAEEQPEDADNQRNVTRMGTQPSEPSAAVHVPVAPPGPPGETPAVLSEYLPTPQAPLHPPLSACAAAWGQSCLCGPQERGPLLAAPGPRRPLLLVPQASTAPVACLSLRLCPPASRNICKFPARSLGCWGHSRGRQGCLWGCRPRRTDHTGAAKDQATDTGQELAGVEGRCWGQCPRPAVPAELPSPPPSLMSTRPPLSSGTHCVQAPGLRVHTSLLGAGRDSWRGQALPLCRVHAVV